MAIARSKLVDVSVARWYHCVSRCVRKAFLLDEGEDNRKKWLEIRLEELADVFAVAVGGFSLMDNHLHVLLRLDPAVARTWSDDEVVRRWGRLFPPRDKSRQPIPLPEQWIQERLDDAQWIAKTRERLQSLSWFMKCLKEPLSRLANRQDKTRGAFFEGRFRSVAVVDDESLLKSGRIYGPTLSPGKSLDLRGAGRDLRAAGFERPALAARDGKAPRRSFGGPLLRGQPRETAGNRRPDRRAAPGQPDGLSDPMTRS